TDERLAGRAVTEGERGMVVADAQQNRVYQQCFARSGDKSRPVEMGPLRVLTADELYTGSWPANAITGPGLHKLGSTLPPAFRPMPLHFWQPELDTLLALGCARSTSGGVDDAHRLAPIYLRPSAAEEQWKGAATAAP